MDWIRKYRDIQERMADWQWKRHLRSLGWQPADCGLEQLVLPQRFELFPAARAVLVEFGGCRLKGPRSAELVVDPSECLKEYADVMHQFARNGREPFYPIGVYERGDEYHIIVTPAGHAYGATCEGMIALGRSFEDAVKFLFGNRKMREDVCTRWKAAGMRDWKAGSGGGE